MKYLERFLRYVFWVAVTAVITWIAKKVFASVAQNQMRNSRPTQESAPHSGKAKKLFKDPVCGMYVAEDISQTISLGQDTETLHFCSRDCMERYRRGRHADDPEAGGGRVAAGA